MIRLATTALAVAFLLGLPAWGASPEEKCEASKNQEALHGFLRASYAAKKILLQNDAEWERLGPRLKAETPDAAEALKEAYRAGIPRGFTAADREAAAVVFSLLAREGGAKLVGSSKTLTPGTFWTEFDVPTWQQ